MVSAPANLHKGQPLERELHLAGLKLSQGARHDDHFTTNQQTKYSNRTSLATSTAVLPLILFCGVHHISSCAGSKPKGEAWVLNFGTPRLRFEAAAVQLQRVARGISARRRVARMQGASGCIGARWRGTVERSQGRGVGRGGEEGGRLGGPAETLQHVIRCLTTVSSEQNTTSQKVAPPKSITPEVPQSMTPSVHFGFWRTFLLPVRFSSLAVFSLPCQETSNATARAGGADSGRLAWQGRKRVVFQIRAKMRGRVRILG